VTCGWWKKQKFFPPQTLTCGRALKCEPVSMDFSAIQEELLALSPDEQDKVSAFLVSVRLKRDGLLKVVSDRLNDTDRRNWVAWEDLKPELEKDLSQPG